MDVLQLYKYRNGTQLSLIFFIFIYFPLACQAAPFRNTVEHFIAGRALRPIGFGNRPDGQAVIVLGQDEPQASQLHSGLLGAQSAGLGHALQLAPIEDLAPQTWFML